MKLRPYQELVISQLRDSIRSGKKRPIICLPTGSGKTVTFSDLASRAIAKGNKVMVVCHRKELIDQAKKTMSAYGVDVSQVYFEMIETLCNRDHLPDDFRLCIIDECHTANFFKLIKVMPPHVQIIGATATPISASNKNPLNNFFDDVICPITISELINQGSLASPIYDEWQIDSSKLVKKGGDFSVQSQEIALFSQQNLKEALDRRVGKTIIFTPSISMAQQVADLCQCDIVHSKQSPEERTQIVENFKKSGEILVNCSILTTGFDDPLIQTVILYRATTSLSLYLQMCGRGSRPGKEKFYIFDLGGNVKRFQPWHIDRDWHQIFYTQGKKSKEGEIPLKKCRDCKAMIFASSRVCPYCGSEQPVKEKKETLADKIVRTYFNGENPNINKPFSLMSVEELILAADKKNYKKTWVARQLKNRPQSTQLLYKFARIVGYKDGWVESYLKYTK